jgi:hypothetical protein
MKGSSELSNRSKYSAPSSCSTDDQRDYITRSLCDWLRLQEYRCRRLVRLVECGEFTTGFAIMWKAF